MKTPAAAPLRASTVISILIALAVFPFSASFAQSQTRRVVFDGVKSEQKWALKDLNPELPSDWSAATISCWRCARPRRSGFPSGSTRPTARAASCSSPSARTSGCAPPCRCNTSKAGTSRASTWPPPTTAAPIPSGCPIWGPFGDLTTVQSLAFIMDYPINKPTLEIRAVHLAKDDEGSEFLEKTPVLDEFGQWAHADWPRKINSRAQLDKELADEGQDAQARRFRLRPIRRLHQHPGQGHRLLPRRTN